LGLAVTFLIKPLLYLIAFGPMAVLFASVIALACALLMMCVRAVAWLAAATEMLLTEPAGHEQTPPGTIEGPTLAH